MVDQTSPHEAAGVWVGVAGTAQNKGVSLGHRLWVARVSAFVAAPPQQLLRRSVATMEPCCSGLQDQLLLSWSGISVDAHILLPRLVT